ncbi:lethal(2)neighbour of tid protein [Neodiprion virginianus]|uniref:lethal(2)neighbour of tid protein n=1 Tax=Neodiprion fabricii TaxID=2872261 RepID=UPI00076FA456|nr:lethal(2)neighbour of tid protein [Neodiprion fabricii]XP_046609113.1 lethal(2)neighbour of tid protein [Neodiprion virginianus]
MAPRRDNSGNLNWVKKYRRIANNWVQSNLTWSEISSLLTDPNRLPLVGLLLVILEVFVNILVVQNVRYTEIDWKAYMQEVEGFLNGTLDYSKLRGDTGPLVYPAGFVYLYSMLYYATSHGTNIKLAQYVFAVLYIVLLVLVFRIYAKTKKVPPYVLVLICTTSYRIHSIFILRLFNDPVAMVLLFASINLFLENRWHLGSLFYSLAVSVKMNILLFAPALLVAYLAILGFRRTVVQLAICAAVQVVLGLPFLYGNPIAYVKGAFNLGRVFEFKWTVNWRFLPEEVFLNPYFHVGLLVLHLAALAWFLPSWITYLKSYAKLRHVEKDLKGQLRRNEKVDMSTSSQLFILPLFTANFIGIVFSRSLHYQFYVWYFHTLPYIVWCTSYQTVTKIVILGVIELCWNTYPSTIFSSAALYICHIALLFSLANNKAKGTKAR